VRGTHEQQSTWRLQKDAELKKDLLSDLMGHMQVSSKPGVTVGELQRELASWEERYDCSTAAAGPAKRRLRNEFVRGTYQQLLANVERAQNQRLQEAERQMNEVEIHCTSDMQAFMKQIKLQKNLLQPGWLHNLRREL